MQVDKNNWLHVAQRVYHDIIPAKKFGLRAIWIRRRGVGATPAARAKADFEFSSLKELAENIRILK